MEEHSLSFLVQWVARRSFQRLTSRLRVLPDFIILGAQRCGTTSLYNYLVEHPQVAPALLKETHFFDLHFGQGLNWYRSFFPAKSRAAARKSGTRICGESTPYYLFHPHAPQRAKDTIPNARLIVLLRDPVDRAYSHYYHEVSRGAEVLTFEEALEREAIVLPAEAARMEADERYQSFAHMHHSYLSRGVYVDQLARWARCFPREQMLILKSETLYSDPGATVAQAAAFLGLDDRAATAARPVQYKQYNRADYPEMRAETRERLTAYFSPHNERLSEILGAPVGW